MNAVLTPAQRFFNLFGFYTKIPKFLRKTNLSPSAKAVFEVLVELMDSNGLVYICREKIKEETGLNIFTISKAITSLEKNNLLVRTGKFKRGIYPYVQILRPSEEMKEIQAPSEFCQRVAKSPQAEWPNRHTQLRNKQLIIKQTGNSAPKSKTTLKNNSNTDVCFKNSNSKELLEAQGLLTANNVNQKQARKLVEQHGPEAVATQVEHLRYIQEKGCEIKNPAGWLYKALKNNYAAPKGLTTIAQAKEAAEKKEKISQAENFLKGAEELEQQEALEAAKSNLEESLRFHPLPLAEELLQRILKRIKRKELLEQAQQKISTKQQEQLMDQAKELHRTNFRKLGLVGAAFESTQMFLGAVQGAFEEKLLALV